MYGHMYMMCLRFGRNSRVPLFVRVMPAGKENKKAMSYSAFHIPADNLILISCTPATDDRYILLNIRELNGKETELEVLDDKGRSMNFEIVNAIGKKLETRGKAPVLSGVTFSPYCRILSSVLIYAGRKGEKINFVMLKNVVFVCLILILISYLLKRLLI